MAPTITVQTTVSDRVGWATAETAVQVELEPAIAVVEVQS